MTDDVKIALIALIGAFIGTLPALIGYLLQRKKDLLTAENDRRVNEQNLVQRAWQMYQDNVDDILTQLQTLKNDNTSLKQTLTELHTALDSERERRRSVELQLQNVMLTLTIYRTGLLLLISQLQELDVQPRWEPPDAMITPDVNR